MVVFVYLLIVLASVTQSASTKFFSRGSSCSIIFNVIKSCTAFCLFALISSFGFSFNWQTMLFGLLYGASLSISMYAGYKALCCGPMALTSMLVSFSVVIPLCWGITVGNEILTPLQYPALILLFVSIISTNIDKIKATKEKRSGYGLWLLFVVITFLCNGLGSILQKQHQALYPNAYSREFMFFAMLLCSIIFLISALRKFSFYELKATKGKWFGVLAGFTNGISSFLTLVLAGLESASVLFPLISAGTILSAVLCGRFVFKEKLKINHYFALLTGIAAAVLIKM